MRRVSRARKRSSRTTSRTRLSDGYGSRIPADRRRRSSRTCRSRLIWTCRFWRAHLCRRTWGSLPCRKQRSTSCSGRAAPAEAWRTAEEAWSRTTAADGHAAAPPPRAAEGYDWSAPCGRGETNVDRNERDESLKEKIGRSRNSSGSSLDYLWNKTLIFQRNNPSENVFSR